MLPGSFKKQRNLKLHSIITMDNRDISPRIYLYQISRNQLIVNVLRWLVKQTTYPVDNSKQNIVRKYFDMTDFRRISRNQLIVNVLWWLVKQTTYPVENSKQNIVRKYFDMTDFRPLLAFDDSRISSIMYVRNQLEHVINIRWKHLTSNSGGNNP